MLLLTDAKYSKNIEIEQKPKDGTTFYSFYANSNEYGPNIDQYAQVSSKEVKIFDD